MRHAARLTRSDHRTLRGSGFRASSGPVTVHAYPDGSHPAPRAAGFAISTGVGGAVVRNRIRRRLRAALDTLTWSGPIVISARPAAAAMPFAELREHLERAIAAAAGRAARADATATSQAGLAPLTSSPGRG